MQRTESYVATVAQVTAGSSPVLVPARSYISVCLFVCLFLFLSVSLSMSLLSPSPPLLFLFLFLSLYPPFHTFLSSPSPSRFIVPLTLSK